MRLSSYSLSYKFLPHIRTVEKSSPVPNHIHYTKMIEKKQGVRNGLPAKYLTYYLSAIAA